MCSTCVMNGFQNFSSGSVQSSSPRDTASSSSSSAAVKPYSTYCVKCLRQELPTILPMSVGMKRRLSMLDVLAILQRRDDRGVGRRPADAVFLERLHQRGFGEARRRLGEMLVAVHVEQRDDVAVFHRRQDAIVLVRPACVVRAFLVHGDEAGLDQRGAVGAQHVAAGGARFGCLLGSMSTATVSNSAGAICEATARFQISSYSLYWSSDRACLRRCDGRCAARTSGEWPRALPARSCDLVL